MSTNIDSIRVISLRKFNLSDHFVAIKFRYIFQYFINIFSYF